VLAAVDDRDPVDEHVLDTAGVVVWFVHGLYLVVPVDV
jgi:hypothetical protein